MKKKTVRSIVSSLILSLSLFCVFSIGYSSYVVSTSIKDSDSNISVTASEVVDKRIDIEDLTVSGSIVYGPTGGNYEGEIFDDGEGSTESLTATISFTVKTTTTFSGDITFSIAPSSTSASNYASALTAGYILDPIAGSDSTKVGSTLSVASISDGSIQSTASSTGVGVSTTVETSESDSESDTSVSADITLTVTYGWGEYFDYMNPALADEQGKPTHDSSEMITALKSLNGSLSSFTLDAVIGAKADTETAESGEGA